MIIWHEGNGVLLAAKGRDISDIKKAVQFDSGTCLWTIAGDADEVRRSAERSTILKAFDEAGAEPLTPQQVADATGMKNANVRQLLKKMKREGVLTQGPSYGTYTRPGSGT
jgi:hypothetical protein